MNVFFILGTVRQFSFSYRFQGLQVKL
ncbi:unnamed protein product, partial [Rotaria sp. Silwood1]